VTEDRKHVILFAATLLCARQLIETIDSDKLNMAEQHFVEKAIQEVASVSEKIDNKWPVGRPTEMGSTSSHLSG
jgi:hypothetical protein